jgi:hypothetical protein
LTFIIYPAQSNIWFRGCPIQQVHNKIIWASPTERRCFTGLSQVDPTYRYVTDIRCCREIFDFVRENYKNTEVNTNSLSATCETRLRVFEDSKYPINITCSNILLLITFQSNWQQTFPKVSCHLKRTSKRKYKRSYYDCLRMPFLTLVLRSLQNCK